MAGSLRNQGPLPLLTANDLPTTDQVLGRPEEQQFVDASALVSPTADFERGLQQAAAGMEYGHLYREADYAQKAGDLERAASLREAAAIEERLAQGYAPRVSTYKDVHSVGDAIDYAQQGFGQLAPSMVGTTLPAAVGTVVGGALGSVVPGVGTALGATIGAGLAGGYQGFQMEAGEAAASQQADEAIRNLPVEQRIREQNIKGALAGTAELVFPRLVGGRLLKSMQGIFKEIGQEGVKQAGKKFVKDRAKDVALETFTEGATEGTQTLFGQQSLTRLNPNRDTSGDVQELIDSILLGALGGGGISLGTNVPGALTNKITAPKLPSLPKRPPPRGARVSDDDLTAEAAGQAPPGSAAPSISDEELTQRARGEQMAEEEFDLMDPYGPEFVEPGTMGTQDGSGSQVTLEDVDIDEAGRERAKEQLAREMEDMNQPISDEELERRARIRKSSFGTRIPVDTKKEPVLRGAEPEELSNLREMRPFTKGETKGERRYVRSQPSDVKTFLKEQVDRGVISQEVADSAVIEPLGDRLKRKGATEQEMENELAGIVRDILNRIESNRKDGNLDMVKGLTSELENLPIDVQRRGETTYENPAVVERKTAEELTEEAKNAPRRKWKADSKQGDLFPTNESFPIPLSQFKKNHFGLAVSLTKQAQQGELNVSNGMSRQELLVRALNQYSTVLASDAAKGESASSALDTKQSRSRLDTATREQKRQMAKEGKILKLQKKNGQFEYVDADSLAAVAYAQEGGREAILGNRKNVNKQQEHEAAVASGLASQLLRNDIAGLVDPKSGKVVTGVEANKSLQNWMNKVAAQDRKAGETPKVYHAIANKERRALGRLEAKAPELADLRAENRGVIQRGFKAARQRLFDEHQLYMNKTRKNFAKDFGKNVPQRITPEMARELRNEQRAIFKAERDRVRAQIKAATDFAQEAYAKKEELGENYAAWLAAARAALDPEVLALVDNRAKKGTAKFRADRLDMLIETLNELDQTAKQEKEAVQEQTADRGGEFNQEGKSKEQTGVRYAEEHTGADRALPVGQRFGGENKSQKNPTAAQKLAAKLRRLEAELKATKSKAEAAKLITKALGYKPGELPLTNQETHVLLGSIAKQYVRDAMNKAGVPIVGTAEIIRYADEVQGGKPDRVMVLVAKSDLDQVFQSKEFGQLLDSGITIMMPEASKAMMTEFREAGYKAKPQPGGVIAWVPSVGFDSDTRRYSMAGSVASSAVEQEMANLRDSVTPEDIHQMMKATGNEQTLEFVKENFDAILRIYARRNLLNNATEGRVAADEDFVAAMEEGDMRPLAKAIKETFPTLFGERIGLVAGMMDAQANFYPTMDGKRFEFKDGDTSVEAGIMYAMANHAASAQSIISTRILFQQLEAVAKAYIKALEKMTPERRGALFGKAGTSLTMEEAMNLPVRSAEMRDFKFTTQYFEAKEAIFAAGMKGQVERGQFLSRIPAGMTIKQALEGHSWLEKQENLDRIDMKYETDIEKLVTQETGLEFLFGGPLGFFAPTEDRIYLSGPAIKNAEHARWIAWHELMHRGLSVKYGDEVRKVLKDAYKNPTVKKLADVIRLERKIVGDPMGQTELGGVEEALAELGAAIKTGDFTFLEEQYGITVSKNLRTPLEELVQKLIDVMRKVFKNIVGVDTELVSDVNVLSVLNGAYLAAFNEKTDRPRAFASAKSKENIDYGFRFSKETNYAELQNAINQRTRAARQRRISEYLAKVLGDRVHAIFNDMNSAQDAAGWFDWATATINVALNSTNWEGTAHHEAFHAFFHALGKLDSDRAIYERLLKAANAPHIKRQLRRLLAGNKEALDQLRNAEERAAYMFQFYASGDLKLQPETFKTLRKWAQNLARIVGYVSRMESAERIFEQFNSGDLKTNDQIVEMIRREQHKQLAKEISAVWRPMNQGLRAVVMTATDRLRGTNNMSLKRIADLFASEVKGGGMTGYLSMRGQKEGQFRNQFNDVLDRHLEGLDDAQQEAAVKEALEQLQAMKPNDQLSPMAKDIRKVLRRMFFYLSDKDGNGANAVTYPVWETEMQGDREVRVKRWKPIDDAGPLYFPRIWDHTNIINNWDEFVRDMKAESNDEITTEQLEAFRARLKQGDGMMEFNADSPLTDPAMRAINQRIFKFITPANAHKFTKYQSNDLAAILTTYARQAAQRGESQRHFGNGAEKLDALLKQAKEEGATEAELKMADKAIKALQGTLGSDKLTPLKKNAMMTGMTIVNLAVLPLALFSSLVDPLGVMVRTGDMKAAGKTFMAGVQQILDDVRGIDDSQNIPALAASAALAPNARQLRKRGKRYERAQHLKLAKFLGIVEQEQVLSVIGDSYNSMFANEQLQKINTRFFKLIGLDSWTKGTRIGAMVASMEYLKEYKDDARRMGELGLEPGDIVVQQDGQIDLKPSSLGQDKARRVQAAIYRMVDESILRPTASQRPIFMSDMRFMLLGHLKQFTFSFHNTIIKQVAKNISENLDDQNYVKAVTQVLPLLSYVPAMMAADILRSAVAGRMDDDDDRDFGDFFYDSVQRSGVMGVSTFGMDALDDIAYGGAPINTFLGPVVHKGARLVESAIDPDERFTAQAVRLLPGYAFWKGWLE